MQRAIYQQLPCNHCTYKLGYIDALKQVLGPASSPLKKARFLRDFANMNFREHNRQ
jgi:hypothetical protein